MVLSGSGPGQLSSIIVTRLSIRISHVEEHANTERTATATYNVEPLLKHITGDLWLQVRVRAPVR